MYIIDIVNDGDDDKDSVDNKNEGTWHEKNETKL